MPSPTPRCPLDLQGAKSRLRTVHRLLLTVSASDSERARDKPSWGTSRAAASLLPCSSDAVSLRSETEDGLRLCTFRVKPFERPHPERAVHSSQAGSA